MGDTAPIRRIAFFASGHFAVVSLLKIIAADIVPVIVITNSDKPSRRGLRVRPTVIATTAQAHQIPVTKIGTIDDCTEPLRDADADIGIVCDFGALLPSAILTIPRYGCINIHPSLLPRWRGASPIENTLLAGDSASGVSIIQMQSKLDAGDILLQQSAPITDEDNHESLSDKLADLSGELILHAISRYASLTATRQDDRDATYCTRLTSADRVLDLRESSQTLFNRIRAFAPKPGARLTLCHRGAVYPLKILKAAICPAEEESPIGAVTYRHGKQIAIRCSDGYLIPEIVQKSGGKPMPIADFLNGYPLDESAYFT